MATKIDQAAAVAGRMTRLSGADRRNSILRAAKAVFAANGYDGTKTLQIAAAAGVSEALVFRHFASKAVLYRAVLRQLIREQDESIARFGRIAPSGRGLLEMIERTTRLAMSGENAPNAPGVRLLLGSLSSDGSYARLIFRRAKRLVLPEVRDAIEAAVAAGEIEVRPPEPENVVNLMEHVTSMILVSRLQARPVVDFAGGDAGMLADVLRFCGRGIGLRPELVETHIAAMR